MCVVLVFIKLIFPTHSGLRTSDRKSTRLNSSHGYISYAVFCLKKKKAVNQRVWRQPVPAARQGRALRAWDPQPHERPHALSGETGRRHYSSRTEAREPMLRQMR